MNNEEIQPGEIMITYPADLIPLLRLHYQAKGDTEGLDLVKRLEQSVSPGGFIGVVVSRNMEQDDFIIQHGFHGFRKMYAGHLLPSGNMAWQLIAPLDENHETMID